MSLKLCKDHFSPKINKLYLLKMVFFKVYNFPGVYIFQPILIFFLQIAKIYYGLISFPNLHSTNLIWFNIVPSPAGLTKSVIF